MITASGRGLKAVRRRASCPACKMSNVPPSTTRIQRTIRSTRYKNVSGRQTALVNCEEIGIQSIGGLSQSRMPLDDLQLFQHVRPHHQRARRPIHGEERMVGRDGFEGYGGLYDPSGPPSTGDELRPFARRLRLLDSLRGEGCDYFPRHALRAETASHQNVRKEARLHGRVPTVEVHGRIGFEEAHLPSGADSF